MNKNFTMDKQQKTRSEHLEYCKKRALAYCEQNELRLAFASMAADLKKHPETEGHAAISLGALLVYGGFLETKEKMVKFINDFE